MTILLCMGGSSYKRSNENSKTVLYFCNKMGYRCVTLTCYDDTIEVIEIIIASLSLSLVHLACTLKLFDILSDAYRNLMLFIFHDTDKIFSLLSIYFHSLC